MTAMAASDEAAIARTAAPFDAPARVLEPIARETYGVLIYQEQVMQAARVLAGYTLGGADILRRAKVDPDRLMRVVVQVEAAVLAAAPKKQGPETARRVSLGQGDRDRAF